MKIDDVIYGQWEIEEPVLIELINSKPVQRLKKIAQLGVPDQFYHLKGFSRFEHSAGVMLLLKKLKTPLEEQIAGLLHDISHTTFSHVVDWTIGCPIKEDHQDKNHRKFFFGGEVTFILKKYSFNPDKIANLKEFKLLEREIPNLCADRIDYALRDFYIWANPGIVKSLIENLIAVDGKTVFINFKSANLFAATFLKCQKEHWGGYEAVARYYLFSLALKEALKKKILKMEDFYQEDDFVVKKLIKSRDEKILKILNFLKQKTLPRNIKGKTKIVKKKFRYVDPEFIANGEIKKLSQVSKRFKKFLEKQRILNQRGVKIFLNL